MTINVSIKDTEIFEEVLQIMKDFACDKRVPIDIRDELKSRIDGIIEQERMATR